jgi:hypothetical protein
LYALLEGLLPQALYKNDLAREPPIDFIGNSKVFSIILNENLSNHGYGKE